MMEAKRAKVAIVHCKNRREGVRKAIELLGGMEKWVKPGDKVLLKPNLMTAMGSPMITHIDTLIEIYALCKEAGASEVAVGENSICGMSPRTHFEYAGYIKPLERAGLKMVFFDEQPWVYKEKKDNLCLKDMHIPAYLAEADVWISVPVAKTHVATEVTLGMKNNHGIIPDEDRARHHRHRPQFNSSLLDKFVDILAVAKPNLTIMDMFTALEGQGPATGRPVKMELILASEDLVACDAVTEALMGFSPLSNPLTIRAHNRGLGVGDLREIEILGESLEKHKRMFKRAIPGDVAMEDEVITILRGDVCRCGCAMPLSFIRDFACNILKKDIRELGAIYFLVGLNPPPPPEDRFVLAFGDCAVYSTWNYSYRQKPKYIGPWWKRRKAYHQVFGCPPLGLEWIRGFSHLCQGYSPLFGLAKGIAIWETEEFNFAKGITPDKNSRFWMWNPQLKKIYQKEIAESKTGEYKFKNEDFKGAKDGEW